MADKNIDLDELVKLIKSGAEVSTEQLPAIIVKHDDSMKAPTVIAQFDELIATIVTMLQASETRFSAKLKAIDGIATAIADSNKSRNSADVARSEADTVSSKKQLEVLATLQSLVRSGSTPKVHFDLSPLKSLVESMHKHESSSYEFDIKRDQNGYLYKIIATPN